MLTVGPEERAAFARYLKQARAALGISRAECARRVGYSVSYLADMEKDGSPVGIRAAKKLAQGYGVPPESLTFKAWARDDGRTATQLRHDIEATYYQATPEQIEARFGKWLRAIEAEEQKGNGDEI